MYHKPIYTSVEGLMTFLKSQLEYFCNHTELHATLDHCAWLWQLKGSVLRERFCSALIVNFCHQIIPKEAGLLNKYLMARKHLRAVLVLPDVKETESYFCPSVMIVR